MKLTKITLYKARLAISGGFEQRIHRVRKVVGDNSSSKFPEGAPS
jgi:hypothetical protein